MGNGIFDSRECALNSAYSSGLVRDERLKRRVAKRGDAIPLRICDLLIRIKWNVKIHSDQHSLVLQIDILDA
jgi:hypothetical protein